MGGMFGVPCREFIFSDEFSEDTAISADISTQASSNLTEDVVVT